ncbi:MAG: hypothetical protein U0904_00850 [Candidatus Nanopelagicales bacterium]|nr:hypothetical protein [Candidatus Nanopelagicales bacterium]
MSDTAGTGEASGEAALKQSDHVHGEGSTSLQESAKVLEEVLEHLERVLTEAPQE